MPCRLKYVENSSLKAADSESDSWVFEGLRTSEAHLRDMRYATDVTCG